MNFKFLLCLFLALAAASCKSIKSLVDKGQAEYNGCSGSDCVIYDLSTQDSCVLKASNPTYNLAWVKGLSRNVDWEVFKGRIAAFRLQWFSGSWSGWFVPGINDIDIKFNTANKTMRRWWAYFYDHKFQYIICV